MVKLGGPLSDAATRSHLQFCVAAGFNAVWIYGYQAGRWTAREAPGGPVLDPSFLDLARWCRGRGVRIAVSVNPVADSRGDFLFSDPGDARRIRAFFELLDRKAGVHDFVLSFDDQPTRLVNLKDIGHYGFGTALAHLDLARRLASAVPPREKLWLCASTYCDSHLGDGTGRYAKPFLEGLARIPARIGIVWTGPTVISRSITGAGLAATRARLGGRELLLYDNYPANDDNTMDVLGVILGPIRHRDASVAAQIGAYLACPMTQLGASRLALLTIADYLAAPGSYDPDASWRRAIVSLAGADEGARRALEAQAAEWGGFVGETGYQDADAESPESAAESLGDPAAAAAWRTVAEVYPGRTASLRSLADREFRDQLLSAMARRLAIARAWPIARDYRDRRGEGGEGFARAAAQLQASRQDAVKDPQALRALDRFLEAAEIPIPAIATPVPP